MRTWASARISYSIWSAICTRETKTGFLLTGRTRTKTSTSTSSSRYAGFTEYWKKGRLDSPSPKKERNGSNAKNFTLNGIAESGFAQTAKTDRQKPARESTSSLEKKSYSFFKTDHKREKSKEKHEHIGSLKRQGPKEPLGDQHDDISVLTELEKTNQMKDMAASENLASNAAKSNRNSSSLHGSPDPVAKKPDTAYSSTANARQPVPANSLSYPAFAMGLPHQIAAVSGTPLKQGVLQGFHSDTKFVLPNQAVPQVGLNVGMGVPHNPTLFQMLFTPKSTKPPGLGISEEPQLLKSIVARP